MRKSILYYIMMAGSMIAFSSCADLSLEETDSQKVITEGTFVGVNATTNLVASYADLRGQSNHENTFGLQEATTDEILIPTRGTDWGDNGVWREMATHQWTASHLWNSRSWNELNSNVYRTNLILTPPTVATAQQTAEAKFLRAWNMYLILDIWRQVPFRLPTDPVLDDPKIFTPEEAFKFIEKDLIDALPALPTNGPDGDTQHATRAAANYLLAKLYLNKHIYLSAAAPDAADMTKVVEFVDAVTADGYQLHDGYFDNFKPENTSEIILWTDASVGNRIWSSLHYAQGVPDNTGGGWNGFATTAEFYDKFEGDPNSNFGSAIHPDSLGQEERRGYVATHGLGYGFLIGQQYAADGSELPARGGQKLAFTKDVTSLTGASDVIGTRILKYNPKDGGSFRTHFVLFRYADAYLMKIEAILRGGTSSDDAEILFDDLRTLRKTKTDKTVSLDEILDERARELYVEGWRRTDLVRFGKFNSAAPFNVVTSEDHNIMPIPDIAVSSNPNLKQNPGY